MANEEQLAILKQDADTWNEWRKKNPEAMIDLSRTNLSGADLSKADLSGADLSGANLIRAKGVFTISFGVKIKVV